MVRDLVQSNIPVMLHTYREWDDGVVTNLLVQESSTVHLKRWRSEIVQSDHLIATNYSAFRYKSTPYSGEFFTGWSGRTRRSSGVYGTYRTCTDGGWRMPQSYWGDTDASPGSVPSWVVRQANGTLLTSLINSDVNVGNLLGEMPESVKMITSNAITVLRAYRALRRRDYKAIPKILGVSSRKDAIGSPASVWFAYKFGWKPLIDDTYKLHSEVLKQLNRPKFARAKSVAVTEQLVSSIPAPYTSSYTIEPKRVTKGCQVSVNYKVNNEWLAGLNSLGLVNPVSIAWELVPLSFVVDWFIPIGSFLEQITAPLGLEFHSGYKTRFAYGDMRIVRNLSPGTTGVPYGWDITSFGMQREKLTSFPLPSIVLNFGVNFNQILTFMGLLSQRL